MSANPWGELWHSLYGAPDGQWLIVIGKTGHVGPPAIGDMQYIGPSWDVFTKMYYAIEAEVGSGARIQQRIADIAGVGQTSVSHYINGESVPQWDSVDWANVVRAIYSMRKTP